MLLQDPGAYYIGKRPDLAESCLTQCYKIGRWTSKIE